MVLSALQSLELVVVVVVVVVVVQLCSSKSSCDFSHSLVTFDSSYVHDRLECPCAHSDQDPQSPGQDSRL